MAKQLPAATINDFLAQNLTQHPDLPAFQIRQENKYLQYTFNQVAELVAKIQSALTRQGIKKGDRVILWSENRPEWPISYLAITTMGAVVVPLDVLLHEEEAFPLIADSGACAAIVTPRLEACLSRTKISPAAVFTVDQLADLPSPDSRPKFSVQSADVAAIVYTSGTTGSVKGVTLTHGNITANVNALAALFDFGPRDNFLSVLPLHHAFETTAGFLAPFSYGCRLTYAQSLKSYNLLRDMRETGVTIMCGVPLLFQLFYDGIWREAESQGKEWLFSALFILAKFLHKFIGFSFGRWLFAPVHKKFGGKIRFFVSGGAALGPEVARNFELIGFTILQGYGLTESAPILTCNTLRHNKIGSVGRPLPGVEIRIAGTDPVGEIIAFGPNIMRGYYQRPDLTSRVIINGCLYTGDVGYLDEDGYLFITGRSKDVIVTGSGVNVYPEEIESFLQKVPGVKECCVVGDKVKSGVRKGAEEVLAIIVPDKDYFVQQGISDPAQVHKTMAVEIDKLNVRLADYKRIARFQLRDEELPKTRLKKLKRFEIAKELKKQ
jgi:long-chain acyl-CoA synthetase